MASPATSPGTTDRSVLGRGFALQGWKAVVGYLLLTVVLWGLLLLSPPQYQLRLANLIVVQVVAALGANIILGYAGLVSIAHAATMAIGAYVSALVTMKLGWPFPAAFLSACVLSAIVSGIVGILGTRIQANYFLLITLALAGAVRLVILNEDQITGGATGLFGVPPATILGWTASTDADFYLLGVPIAVLALYFAQRLKASRTGRAMLALRMNEPAAMMSGVDVKRHRVAAMAMGGAYLGASGSLFAHLVQFLGPESFGLNLALLLTLMVVVGGIGSNLGTVVSVAVVVVVTAQIQDVGNAWVLFYGLLIMAMLVVAPRGLAWVGLSLAQRVSRRR